MLAYRTNEKVTIDIKSRFSYQKPRKLMNKFNKPNLIQNSPVNL